MQQSDHVAEASQEGRPTRPTKHCVLPGETVEDIAYKYGLFTAELRRVNDLWARPLQTGETLTIPALPAQRKTAVKS